MSFMKAKPIIRQYESKDKDQLYSLILAILEQEFGDLPTDIYLDDIGDVPRFYSGKGNKFWVCVDGDRVVGSIAVKQDDEETALMRRLFVNPHYRRKRIAKAMVEEALAFLREEKYKKVFFVGNIKMHQVKALLMGMGFEEDESIAMAGLGIFKLSYSLT